jgi:hypothetical protein
MIENNIPDHSFTKNLEYINSRLKKRRILFSNNVKLDAPSDNFNELIEIRDVVDGKTLVAINGYIIKSE